MTEGDRPRMALNQNLFCFEANVVNAMEIIVCEKSANQYIH